MYRQFNIQQFYVLPTQCIYVFCVDLRTNSHYFPILTGFYNRDLTLCSPVGTICTISSPVYTVFKQSCFRLKHLAMFCLEQQMNIRSQVPTQNLQSTNTLRNDVIIRNWPPAKLKCGAHNSGQNSASEASRTETEFRCQASHCPEMVTGHVGVDWIDVGVVNSVFTAVRGRDSASWRGKRLLAPQLLLC